jgi:AmiR/NasT family two-component response regulator
VIGALNLFGSDRGRLDPDDVKIIQALADVTTIALLQEQAINRSEVLTEQLQHALTSRIVIEQAKGMVAQLYNVQITEAFELLRSYARANQRRLLDVAQAVVTNPATFPNLAAR